MSLAAAEDLAAGSLIHIAADGTARLADASSAGQEAVGYTAKIVSAGDNFNLLLEGKIPGLSGLTKGARYYLDTTPGKLTSTPPSGAAQVVQFVGRAVNETEVIFEQGEGVIRA